MGSKLVLIVSLACLALAWADEQIHEDEVQEENTGLSAIQLPGDFTISEGVLRAVSFTGALVTGVAGLAALLSFVMPILGFRTCLLMGNCDVDATAYSNPATNSVYDHQGFSGYNYNSGFKKRSLEYVGPILKALSSAYDKYGPPAQQRKLSNHAVEQTKTK